MDEQPLNVLGLPLHSRPVVHPLQEQPSAHGKGHPDHGEEGGFHPQKRQGQCEECPDEFADVKVERLDHPETVVELKVESKNGHHLLNKLDSKW